MAELAAMKQRVGELDRQREEIQAASDQKIAELTQLLEVPVNPSQRLAGVHAKGMTITCQAPSRCCYGSAQHLA